MGIESSKSDKMLWLANQIFTAFPRDVTGLKFYVLDCGCIYYQRVFRDGGLDSQIGIYRNAEDGPCEICMVREKSREVMVINKFVVYNRLFQFLT